MSPKLKALGLGLLAAVAANAFATMSAPATTGGHFVSSGGHAEVKGLQVAPGHQLEFVFHGLSGGIVCDTSSYTGTITSTSTEVLITPTYSSCHTTGSETASTIHVNGCQFRFTVAPGESTEQTIHLVCPTQPLSITHPNCTVTIAAQTVSGVTYTTVTESGKHALTLDVNVQVSSQYHAGICIFLGTTHTATLKGALTANGFNTAGEPTDITAT
jgi:hypothetical protein